MSFIRRAAGVAMVVISLGALTAGDSFAAGLVLGVGLVLTFYRDTQ